MDSKSTHDVVDHILSKLNEEDGVLKKFLQNPEETLKKDLGLDIDDEKIKKAIETVKEKFMKSGDEASEAIKNIMEKAGGKEGLTSFLEKAGTEGEGLAKDVLGKLEGFLHGKEEQK